MGGESESPLTVKYRHAKINIHKKPAKHPFYRITCRAEGRRVIRRFKTRYPKESRPRCTRVRHGSNRSALAARLAVRQIRIGWWLRTLLRQ